MPATKSKKKELVVKTTGNALPWEAAEFLKWSPAELRKRSAAGEVPFTWCGSHRRYSWEMLHKLLANKSVKEYFPEE